MDESSGKITLVSYDDVEYSLELRIANLSYTLRIFLDPSCLFNESISRRIKLPIRSSILKRLVDFMEYKSKATDNKQISEFQINDEETLDLLDAASYLRI